MTKRFSKSASASLLIFFFSILGCSKTGAIRKLDGGRNATMLDESAASAAILGSKDFKEASERMNVGYIPHMVLCQPTLEGQSDLIQLRLATIKHNIDAYGNCSLELTDEGSATFKSPGVISKQQSVMVPAHTGWGTVQSLAYIYSVPLTSRKLVKILSVSDGGMGSAYVEFTWMRVPGDFLKTILKASADKTEPTLIVNASRIGIVEKGTAELSETEHGWSATEESSPTESQRSWNSSKYDQAMRRRGY